MKNLKKISVFIILLMCTSIGYSQFSFDHSIKTKPQQEVLVCNNPDSIVHSIPSPPGMINGITFDGNSLWAASTNYSLYKISPNDGTIQKTLDIAIGYATGLTFIDPDLYLVDRVDKRICRIDTATGNIIEFFNTPEFNASGFPSGLTWDGNSLWYNCAVVDTTYQLNLSGQVLTAHKVFGSLPTGLTFDGNNLWSIDSDLDLIYKIDLPGYDLIVSIEAPGAIANGLAFDGEYLWVSENTEGLIYQMYIGISTNINSYNNAQNFINVWPNPNNGFAYVELPVNCKVAGFDISRLDGQRMKSFQLELKKQSTPYRLDLSGLNPGIYILSANMPGKTISEKILIR